MAVGTEAERTTESAAGVESRRNLNASVLPLIIGMKNVSLSLGLTKVNEAV